MSDSSDNESGSSGGGSGWVPYSERTEWADVKPLEQDDGPEPVVSIAYSAKFKDVFDYFRAIVCSGEVSERALSLTTDAAKLNPANYSVWHHRRFLLKGLADQAAGDIKEELKFTRAMLEENPKNYQIWQHRKALVECAKDTSQELRLTEMILAKDSKNYHAWQYRQWIVTTTQMFDQDLVYATQMLEDDIRNNTAWNERFFAVLNREDLRTGCYRTIGGDTLRKEVEFVLGAIAKVPNNESSWNYLRGLIDYCEDSASEELQRETLEFCEILYKDKKERSPHLLAFMADQYREKKTEKDGKKALELITSLATEYDVIRKEYWEYLAGQIVKESTAEAASS